jgi:hypothetical protein
MSFKTDSSRIVGKLFVRTLAEIAIKTGYTVSINNGEKNSVSHSKNIRFLMENFGKQPFEEIRFHYNKRRMGRVIIQNSKELGFNFDQNDERLNEIMIKARDKFIKQYNLILSLPPNLLINGYA